MSDPLENYVANLLREKGVPDSAGARSELLARVNDAIDQALVEALSDEQLSTLEAAAKEDRVDEGMMARMLQESGATPKDITANALRVFRDNYLKGVA